jgi:polysaccharide deacetylase 2 family uncharacterized protein YibQ
MQGFFSIILLLFVTQVAAQTSSSAQLVIIIDDIGNNYAQGQAMVELEGPLTLAFLPHTPYAKKLASNAHQRDKEIILHAPMENSVAAPLGPGALTKALSKTEFQQTLTQAIAAIPYIQGINNHMGSALTQNAQAMQWVMETLQQEQLYFVDSLTSAKSVAYQQAKAHQLPALRRHVFLDNQKTEKALSLQWDKALRIAKKTGRAILIGHPYPESHAFLAKNLPKLAAQGIELVPASRLLLQQAWQGFEKGELTVHSRPNRYLLHNKNNRANEQYEQDLISYSVPHSKHN